MARVWVAEQTKLARRVAVKVLADEMIETAAARELFEREARATARVDHPHVVRILDFDVSADGTPFLVFELLVGQTLEQRLRRGPLDLDEARTIMSQACDALAFAHARGVLHRDLKAQNLFLQHGRSGGIDLKVLDFGVALDDGAPPMHDLGVVGTPAYMSPEQLSGGGVDARTDLFALGVCVYYALTRKFPYPGDTPDEAARSLERGAFTPMSALRPDLPPSLDDWFSRALAIDRGARFDDARTMLAAFELACQPSCNTIVALDVSESSVTRRRGASWGTAALLVVAFASLVFVRVKPAPHVAPLARAREPAAAPPVPDLAGAAIATNAIGTSALEAPIRVVSIDALPRAAKQRAAPARDAGLDAKPAVEPAPSEDAPDFGY